MTRRFPPLCTVLLLALAAPAEGAARHEPGELLVLMADPNALTLGASGEVVARDPRLRRVLGKHGLARYAALGPSRSGRLEKALRLKSDTPGFDPVVAAREVQATGQFRAVAPNLELDRFATIPNDTYFGYQWHLNTTLNSDAQLPEAWDLWKGDPGTIIAVIDNGLDVSHPDLASKVWINPGEIPANSIDDDGNGYVDDVRGWDFGNDDADPSSEPTFDELGIDVGFHGTFVAGIAAAATHNGLGIAGAGWHCRFMALKVGAAGDSIPLSAVTEALLYAIDQQPAVINLSLGTADPSGSAFFQALMDDANAAGILVVAAAGNSGVDTQTWPAACDGVMAVGATDESNARASFSNYGPWVDIAAPGAQIWSSICQNYPIDDFSWIFYVYLFGYDGENPYMLGDGTSFSSPLVAGIAGLVRSKHPWMSPAAVASHLVATGDVVAYDQPIGRRVNAFRALSQSPLSVGGQGADPIALAAPVPNPFTSQTSLGFSLSAAAPVRLAILDASGRRVRTLAQATFPPGRHAVLWNGMDARGHLLGNGIYLAALEVAGQRSVQKLVLAR